MSTLKHFSIAACALAGLAACADKPESISPEKLPLIMTSAADQVELFKDANLNEPVTLYKISPDAPASTRPLPNLLAATQSIRSTMAAEDGKVYFGITSKHLQVALKCKPATPADHGGCRKVEWDKVAMKFAFH